MAFSYQQQQQSTDPISIPPIPPITNTNPTPNYDAPLIGDLKFSSNNDNSNNLLYSNDSQPFYDNDDTMSTFGLPIDNAMYGSPSLGFDYTPHHLSNSIPTMHLSPVPPFDTALPTVPTVTNNNNNKTENANINNNICTTDTTNTNSNNTSLTTLTSFDIDSSTHPSSILHLDHIDSINNTYTLMDDITHDPMFDTIRFGVSSRSEFTLDPLDQSTIFTVSDGISQFLNPFSTPQPTESIIPTVNTATATAQTSLTRSETVKSIAHKCDENGTTDTDCAIDMTPINTCPPQYRHIKHNIFIGRKKRKHTHGQYQYKCDCHYTANGDNCRKNACYNKLFYYECTDGQSCSVEDETNDANMCRNRRFQRNEWKQLRVQSAGKKGWGLYAGEDINDGEFIIEYVGEVIHEKECKKRLANEYFGKHKFYILKLEGGKKGESIDATTKGGPARFINHSCQPNCISQKWTVGGELCLGFFADRDIKCGEELTFDYQFQRYGSVRQKCYCGASNCRKYLGAPILKSPRKDRKRRTNGNTKRTYKKNAKIVQRNMDERIVIKSCYDSLMKLTDKEAIDMSENEIMNKCMAKGRLLRKQYINSSTGGGVLNNSVTFDEIIRPYPYQCESKMSDGLMMREPDCKGNLLNIEAMREFENIVCKQYKNGYDFELEHLSQMKHINETLNSENKCGENQCKLCVLYGHGSCHTIPIYQIATKPKNTATNDEQMTKKYLKLKQVSQRKVMEHKIKNSFVQKKHKKKAKKQSKSDMAYAANLHEQLNKPHLRRHTRSSSSSNEIIAPQKVMTPKTAKKSVKHSEDSAMESPVCDKCGMSKDALKTKGTWSRHLHSKHTYHCKQCPLQFTTSNTLGEHEKARHKSKDGLPDTCVKCGRARGDTNKSHWNKHIQTEHRYPCAHCSYKFAHRKKYNEHLRGTHSINNHSGTDGDVEMVTPTSDSGKKRKYNALESSEEVSQRKKRKLNAESESVNEAIIDGYLKERDCELALYQFIDFDGYSEDEELMVKIYDKMDKNDAKYKSVFEKEECYNKEIRDCMTQFQGSTSLFNALIFPNKSGDNITKPVESKSKPVNNTYTIVTQVTPQPIVIRSQTQTQPKPKINNAHFGGGPNMSHRYAHTKYSKSEYPSNNSTPISHSSYSSTSHRSSSHSSHTNHDRGRGQRNNHYSHSSYDRHSHRSHHRYNSKYKSDPENKTLFVDNIPMGITLKALENALKKNGSIKDIMLRTKQNQQSQYANVTCYQKHICDSLIMAGRKAIPLQLPNGKVIHQKLSIHYHNQQKVDDAREKRRKEMEERCQNQS